MHNSFQNMPFSLDLIIGTLSLPDTCEIMPLVSFPRDVVQLKGSDGGLAN